jgi:hypothetical protein
MGDMGDLADGNNWAGLKRVNEFGFDTLTLDNETYLLPDKVRIGAGAAPTDAGVSTVLTFDYAMQVEDETLVLGIALGVDEAKRLAEQIIILHAAHTGTSRTL